MNALELALKKQRLQFRSDALRTELARQAHALEPAFDAADRVREAARWIGRHPQLVVGATVALLVARPRAAWRWARRAFVGWQAWRRISLLLKPATPPV